MFLFLLVIYLFNNLHSYRFNKLRHKTMTYNIHRLDSDPDQQKKKNLRTKKNY